MIGYHVTNGGCMNAPDNEHRIKIVKPLVLKKKDLIKNTEQLFERLENDDAARTAFIENPNGVLSGEVLKRTLPEQKISDANRVLFSMLANDRFREWLDDYEARPQGQRVTDAQFSKDFADAVVKYGDSDLIRALFQQAADGFGLPGFHDVAEQFVIGPEKSTFTSPATPSTSDKSANSSQNFNNKSTGVQFGWGALSNPALLRAIIGQLIAHAKELQASGKLRV
ncbi:hypothetical protein ACFFXZ_09710 [Massilia antarctica]